MEWLLRRDDFTVRDLEKITNEIRGVGTEFELKSEVDELRGKLANVASRIDEIVTS